MAILFSYFLKLNRFNFIEPNSLTMKKIQPYQIVFFLILSFTLSSCEIIGGIFEAGIWVGVIIVVVLIALVIWVIKKMIS